MKNNKNTLNQKGFAVVESVVLMVVFLVLFTYSIGFFGAIHTGIKNSIAARNYAFESFRNRANTSYFRDTIGTQAMRFNKSGFRLHNIVTEKPNRDESTAQATDRRIAYVRNPPEQRQSSSSYTQLPKDLETQVANPIWIKARYGLCLNSGCGD